MKFSVSFIWVFLFFCIACNENSNSVEKTGPIANSTIDTTKDQAEIQTLIRQMLNWSDSKQSIDLLPAIANEKDTVYMGFDLNKLQKNIEQLSATNFFAAEFVANYKQIILTLDKKLRNKEFESWAVGELPTFAFANDVDPWCLCQDVPYDKPNPWDLVTIEIIHLDSENGELLWHWGKIEVNSASDWKDSGYKFKVVRENGKWKIAYLEGFDFNISVRKDGL